MNVFEAVKQSVTTRQAAEHYGIHIGRNVMAFCPFHNDKTPSMKLDWRYHCFGCGADGDVIDFAAALYGLGKPEVLCQLYGGFFLSQPIQGGGKINHIPIRTAAEAVVRRSSFMLGVLS